MTQFLRDQTSDSEEEVSHECLTFKSRVSPIFWKRLKKKEVKQETVTSPAWTPITWLDATSRSFLGLQDYPLEVVSLFITKLWIHPDGITVGEISRDKHSWNLLQHGCYSFNRYNLVITCWFQRLTERSLEAGFYKLHHQQESIHNQLWIKSS